MVAKNTVIAIFLVVAAAVAAAIALWFKALKPKMQTSQTFDPRTWTLSEDDIAIVNSLTGAQQKAVAERWTEAIKANPTQSGEALYKLLIRTAV